METTFILVVITSLGFIGLLLMAYAFAMLAFIFVALAVSFVCISPAPRN